MIAPIRTECLHHDAENNPDTFSAMLHPIRRQASIAFRRYRSEAREELIQEVIANSYRAWVRLIKRGRADVALPTPLAQFAIRQVRAGRKVGSRQSRLDLLSPSARRIHGFTIGQLDHRDDHSDTWQQLLVEDRRSGPSETAAVRIDMAAWFQTLSRRNRRIANALALGGSTGSVARQFGISHGRVSQLRRWFRQQWEQFQEGRLVGPAA
jgi:hypothetical protein